MNMKVVKIRHNFLKQHNKYKWSVLNQDTKTFSLNIFLLTCNTVAQFNVQKWDHFYIPDVS